MPAPKLPPAKPPPQYVYVRASRYGGVVLAETMKDAEAWARAGVAVYRYKVDAKVEVGQ